MKTRFGWLRAIWRRKAAPGEWSAVPGGVVDGWRREPAPAELVAAYRDTAYFCANLNARGVARTPIRLYVQSRPGQARPRCATRALAPEAARRLSHTTAVNRISQAGDVAEVVEHPLLDLLHNPCRDGAVPLLNCFDLFELTQLYWEICGRAYWYVERDVLAVPRSIWVLPTPLVTAVREPGSRHVLDYYLFGNGADRQRLDPASVIDFRAPDPANPYTGGRSPLQAAFERLGVAGTYVRQTQAFLDNRARPDAIIAPSHPEGVIGDAEAKRLEAAFNRRFRGGGQGGILVARDSIAVQPLGFSPRDLGELAENQFYLEQIARAFDIPLSLLHRDANRASAEQGRAQHAKDALLPRITRLQEQLNQRLVPMFDPSGRLFLAFDDPAPEDVLVKLKVRESNLRAGLTTINEERALLGLPPLPWGDGPTHPSNRTAAPDGGNGTADARL